MRQGRGSTIVSRRGMTAMGRDRELIQLFTKVDRIAPGAGDWVVIEGEPGMGKTMLVEAVIGYARKTGLTIAASRASELDVSTPLSTLAAALGTAVPRARHLASQLAGSGKDLEAIHELAAALEETSQSGPLLVVIDDAHWSDAISALALRMLLPGLRSSPILWLMTRRRASKWTSSQQALDWLIEEGAHRIHLAPLDEAASAKLCAQLIGAEPDVRLKEIAIRTGGNPMLLREIVECLYESNSLVIADGIAATSVSEPPSTLVDLIRQRVDRMSPRSKDVLFAAAVLRGPTTANELATLVGSTPWVTADTAAELVSAGFLVEDGAYIRFSHDFVSEAMRRVIHGPRRSLLHAAAGNLLESLGRPLFEVADHLLRAGDTDSVQRAIGMLVEGPSDLMTGTPENVADLAKRALSVMTHDQAQWPPFVAKAVHWLSNAGQIDTAIEIGEDALREQMSLAERANLLLSLAEACKHAGRNGHVVTCTDMALSIIGRDDDILRTHLLSLQAHALIATNDLIKAESVAIEALELTKTHGDATASAYALSARTITARAAGDLRSALDFGRTAAEMAMKGGALTLQPTLWFARILVMFDDFDQADRIFTAGQRASKDSCSRWSAPMWHYHRADALLLRGDLDKAAAELEVGLGAAQLTGADQLCAPLLGLSAQLLVAQGNLKAAQNRIRAAEKIITQGVTVHPGDLTYSVALVAEASGNHAFEWVQEVIADEGSLNLLLSRDYSAAPALTRISMNARNDVAVRRVIMAVTGLADRHPEICSLVGAAQHAVGIGRRDTTAMGHAIEILRGSPRRPLLAAALQDAAYLSDGSKGDHLRQESVGLWAEMGVHQPPIGHKIWKATTQDNTTVTDDPPSLLTVAEERVVRLVTDGLTNREVALKLFLSPHTVDTHLRHAFAKVGVNSRVELTRWFLQSRAPRPNDFSAR